MNAPFDVPFVHRLRTGCDAFSPQNPLLLDVLAPDGGGGSPAVGDAARLLVFIDDGLFQHWPNLPEQVRAYFSDAFPAVELVDPVQVIAGGEAAKNDRLGLEEALAAIEQAELCRRSFVLAIGGGAMLDVVGLAAALAHRGVRIIRMPTTTVGQADSGVGVKNGINAFGKKNYLGVFAPPWAVINDHSFLTTLSDRDWRSGFAEAIKVALVKDHAFFAQIERSGPAIAQRNLQAAAPIIDRSAVLHLEHIARGGDPFEMTAARPLDFGHWSAHKLEQMTDFRLRHGEAVAIGIALDAAYSKLNGWLPEADLQRILQVLEQLGFCLWDSAMEAGDELAAGLEEFRQHLGGRLTLSMLRGIGCGFEVHTVDWPKMEQAMAMLREQWGGRQEARQHHHSGEQT